MRIDELKKELESIERIYDVTFRISKDISFTNFVIIDDYEESYICIVCENKENILSTNFASFYNLEDGLKDKLFNLFVEYAKTPISEREEEKRFIVPLPGLVTTDGRQQYLTHKLGKFFACGRDGKLRQTWKEKDLGYIPEEYRKYAVELREVE
ncbi:hypothetical protein [Peptoniphilus sp.]|uniref:hypothetical protein n=1 Tax=Peptoniphilus sp. TaxID=1971214 RepID=UPI003995A2FD